MMKRAQPLTCQIRVASEWRTLTIAQAHNQHRSEPKRCSACHGPVYVFGTYTGRSRLGLMHRKGHGGVGSMRAGSQEHRPSSKCPELSRIPTRR